MCSHDGDTEPLFVSWNCGPFDWIHEKTQFVKSISRLPDIDIGRYQQGNTTSLRGDFYPLLSESSGNVVHIVMKLLNPFWFLFKRKQELAASRASEGGE